MIETRYIDPIIESLLYCRRDKGLEVFAFVIMPNHMHMIAAAGEQLHPVIRDFKRFTSRTIHDRLKQDGRTTILNWLGRATQPARRARHELGLWQSGFHPQALYSRKVFEQKLRYLHDNPVRKGLVSRADDWWYSSAAVYCGCDDVCMDIDSLEL
ncbi:MAG: transposase [Phycisphaerae bacterium]